VVELLKKGMDPSENEVRGLVLTSEVPPTLDDALVIAVDLKASDSASNPGDRLDEEFKTDGLGPTDVSSPVQSLPSGDETPGSPSVSDGDGNAEARACI
jgi:hypothetical protein